jgi:hypothetical protein
MIWYDAFLNPFLTGGLRISGVEAADACRSL